MNTALIYPMFALVLLTAVSLMIMFRRRISSVAAGKLKVGFFKTYNSEKPPDFMVQADRHYTNLFELPVLYYAGCITAMYLPVRGDMVVYLAWAYLFFRMIQSYVHLTNNKLRPRMIAFGMSWLCVLGIWGMSAWAVFTHV